MVLLSGHVMVACAFTLTSAQMGFSFHDHRYRSGVLQSWYFTNMKEMCTEISAILGY
jgi:hypothetical protein